MKSLMILLFLWNMAFAPAIETNIPSELEVHAVKASKERITFTLRNNSLKSIPLIIPGVMQPNLSPFSNSGVNLKVGQKILFKYRGKRRLLLKVTPELDGDTLNIPKLIKEQKQNIDKQKEKKKDRKNKIKNKVKIKNKI